MFEKKEDIQVSLEKKMLLLNSPEKQKIYKVMNAISPDNKLSTLHTDIEKAKGMIDIENKLTTLQKSGKIVFTEEQIINECVKFNMHFANSRNFKGELTFDYIDNVIKFVEKNQLQVSDYEWEKNVFIMTNAKFNGDIFSFKSDTDPIIFYKIIEKGETFFVLISDNLKYNKIINRIKGFYYYNLLNKAIVILLLSNLISFILLKSLVMGGGFLACFGLSLFASAITLFFSTLGGVYETNTHKVDKKVNMSQKNNILSLFIIYGGLVFAINHMVDSLAYTINPRYIETIKKKDMTLDEVKENNFVIEPNKRYFKTWKERKLYRGHYFYYTVSSDSSNLQYLNTNL